MMSYLGKLGVKN